MLKVGKIVNTFGIKGELKIVSESESIATRFAVGNKIYINNQEYEITSSRIHKGNALVRLDNIKDINEVEHFKNWDVFVDKQDLSQEKDLYIFELENLDVYYQGNLIGQVVEVMKPHQTVIRIAAEKKEFLLPVVDEFIENIDLANNRIDIRLIEGLYED